MLEDLVVLEMGAGSVPAAFAGMLFADYGARVVKVEPPEGDFLRTASESGFLVWNRGKDSLVLDLRTADGKARLRELAASADVVLEGFGAGVADGWHSDARQPTSSRSIPRAAPPRLLPQPPSRANQHSPGNTIGWVITPAAPSGSPLQSSSLWATLKLRAESGHGQFSGESKS